MLGGFLSIYLNVGGVFVLFPIKNCVSFLLTLTLTRYLHQLFLNEYEKSFPDYPKKKQVIDL